MNNFERIKTLNIDEMVAFLRKTTCRDICAIYEKANGENCDCNSGIRAWLMKEYKGME